MRPTKTIAGTDASGDLNELYLEEVSLVRLERVDADRWCLVCARGKRRVLVHLDASNAIVVEDELGCDPEIGERMAAALFPAMEPDMRARAVDGSPISTASFVPGAWRNGVKDAKQKP